MQPCYQKANLYANEVESHVMHLSVSKDVNKLGAIEECHFKVGY